MNFRIESALPRRIRGALITLAIAALLVGCYFAAGQAWSNFKQRADQADRLGAKQAVLKKAAAVGVSLRIDRVTAFSRCGWCHFRIEPNQLDPLLREFELKETGQSSLNSYSLRTHDIKVRKGSRFFKASIRVPLESGQVLNGFEMVYSPDTGDVYMGCCYAYG